MMMFSEFASVGSQNLPEEERLETPVDASQKVAQGVIESANQADLLATPEQEKLKSTRGDLIVYRNYDGPYNGEWTAVILAGDSEDASYVKEQLKAGKLCWIEPYLTIDETAPGQEVHIQPVVISQETAVSKALQGCQKDDIISINDKYEVTIAGVYRKPQK